MFLRKKVDLIVRFSVEKISCLFVSQGALAYFLTVGYTIVHVHGDPNERLNLNLFLIGDHASFLFP